ncbi:MAG: CotH kinase family protein [Fibrobacterales bacterium]
MPYIIILIILLLIACSDKELTTLQTKISSQAVLSSDIYKESTSSEANTDDSLINFDSSADVNFTDNKYSQPGDFPFEKLFNNQKVPTFNILLTQENLISLDDRPMAEKYVPASFEFDGERWESVEVRYKGSIGSWLYENSLRIDRSRCATSETSFLKTRVNPTTSTRGKICQKLGLKIKFNIDSNPGQRFKGFKKLQLHAMNNDPSQMREQLGYWIFREMGVTAPRTSYARVQINGIDNGLYIAIENIDGRFTRDHFNGGEGNLYKQVMPITPSNKVQSTSTFTTTLKTNEDDSPSIGLMNSFASDLSTADSSTVKDILKKWMDIDEILAHMLVNRVVSHWDSPWCLMNFAGINGKNYYWYEDGERKKFTLIPWDLDNILSDHTDFMHFFTGFSYISPGTPMTPLPTSPKFSACKSSSSRYSYPLCNNLFQGLKLFEDEYLEQVKKFDEKVYPHIATKIGEWQQLITPITQEMNTKYGDPVPWPNNSYGVQGAINETYWLYHLDIVKDQIINNAKEMIEYGNTHQ